MTLNASIAKAGDAYTVKQYQEIRCPCCNRCLGELSGKHDIKIVCRRCTAHLHFMNGEVKVLRPPKKAFQ